jgi:hypothetical protein
MAACLAAAVPPAMAQSPFTLTLTCRVAQTRRFTIAPNTNDLEPGAIQLTPFDVLDGGRRADFHDRSWRYFQYDYTLRLIGDALFGKDVDIPSTNIIYTVQSPDGGGASGRDHTYVMPALAIHIESLVPQKASDIRDGLRGPFGHIEERLARATTAFVLAGIFFSFAAILVGLALARVAKRRQPVRAVRTLTAGAILRGCSRRIARLRSDVSREGWTPQLVGQVLSVLRIVAAVGSGGPVAREWVDANTLEREGQIAIRIGNDLRRSVLAMPLRRRSGALPRDVLPQTPNRVVGSSRHTRRAAGPGGVVLVNDPPRRTRGTRRVNSSAVSMLMRHL